MTASNLRSHIESYLELRQSLGFKTRYQGNVLRAFADYLDAHGHQAPLRARTAVEWAAAESPRKAGPPGQLIRLVVLRGFMRHLKVFFPDTQVPGPGVLARVPRQKPYIYSQEEIRNLQETALVVMETGVHATTRYVRIDRSAGLHRPSCFGGAWPDNG